MKIIGSKALEHFGVNRREPKDTDAFIIDGMFNDPSIDCSVISKELYDLLPTDGVFVTPDAILSLKMSHFCWDIHWEKTLQDILWLIHKGFSLNEEIYQKFKKHWELTHGGKDYLSLYKDKREFFNDHVTYKHDHDYLHELVSFPNKPIYTKCLKDGQEVLIDKEKFDRLDFEDKVRMFREEVIVIACERWVLNDYWKGKISWYQAYHLSLKKTITSLVKNWAADFMVQNLSEFVTPDYTYFKYILEEMDMSNKVDLTVFEELAELSNTSLAETVYQLCENDYSFGSSYKFVNPYPDYKTRDTDPEYDTKVALRNEEREAYYKFIEETKAKYGYEHLVQEGGGEGGSEYCYGVFKLNGKIYKAEYSYYSYNGCEYDDIVDTLREVVPSQKTITVYK